MHCWVCHAAGGLTMVKSRECSEDFLHVVSRAPREANTLRNSCDTPRLDWLARARAVNASLHERRFPRTVKRLLVLQTEEATRWTVPVPVAVKLLAPQYVRVTCFHAAGSSAQVENQVS